MAGGRSYRYVGPADLSGRGEGPSGFAIGSAADLARWLAAQDRQAVGLLALAARMTGVELTSACLDEQWVGRKVS